MEKKRKRGQPTKLLKGNTKDIILDLISKGNYIQTACLAAGITYNTFNNWQRWAEEYSLDPHNGNSNKQIYFNFFQELKNAEAIAESVAISRIEDAGKKPQFWAANAWRLERKDPERWGKREVLEIEDSRVLRALQDRARQSVQIEGITEGITKQIEAKTSEK